MRLFPFPLAPDQGSNFAKQYDYLFTVITLLTLFFTVAVGAVILFFAIKYRAGSKADRSNTKHEHLGVEIAWSLPPLLLGLGIFVWGAYLFIEMRRPPKNAIDIYVIGKQWMWHFEHPNGVREMDELHVPSGIPVKLTMISQDVIHALYIPQFRVQYMVVPGRYTYLWFTPGKPGRYYLFCAQHCGTGHSEMGGYVYVMSPGDYAKWLANGGSSPAPNTETMAQKGEQLFTRLGCGNCHTGQDNERAPTLVGIYGKPVKMSGGATVLANDEYVRTKLVNGHVNLVAGYLPTMPTYTIGPPKGDLSEEDVQALIAYIKSLALPAQATGTSPAVSSQSNAAAALGQSPGQSGTAAKAAGSVAKPLASGQRAAGAKPTSTTGVTPKPAVKTTPVSFLENTR